MGRTTPSLRIVAKEYVERFRKVSELLPQRERILVEKYLEGFDDTLSLYMHLGVVDPLELFILHLVRRIRELCECRGE
jgi:hypothetical protein